jgi:hypothetical protein
MCSRHEKTLSSPAAPASNLPNTEHSAPRPALVTRGTHVKRMLGLGLRGRGGERTSQPIVSLGGLGGGVRERYIFIFSLLEFVRCCMAARRSSTVFEGRGLRLQR